jgi:hypothetical protein
MAKHSVMTEQLKYFQPPIAENRTKQTKRSAITRSLVRLHQYVITYTKGNEWVKYSSELWAYSKHVRLQILTVVLNKGSVFI